MTKTVADTRAVRQQAVDLKAEARGGWGIKLRPSSVYALAETLLLLADEVDEMREQLGVTTRPVR